jgi:hypothetical protein
LIINSLFLLFFLRKNMNSFVAFISSILISKCCYYTFKYLLLSTNLIDGELITTPLEIQFLVALVLSIYGYLILSKSKGVT